MTKYLITGGGFHNNGAESMLYTLISELKDKEPNCEIYVGLNSRNISPEKMLNCNFKLIFDFSKNNKHLINPYLRFIDKLMFKKNSLGDIINDIDVILDISGYQLSSQWGKSSNRNFLNKIKLADKFNKKIIFLPQSFGPFDYTKEQKIKIKDVKKWLPKADLLFAREQDGYNKIKELGIDNVVLSTDMVLQREKEYSNIFKSEIEKDMPEILENSVLILPNKRVFERCDKDDFFNFYNEIISHLLIKQKNVYISYYAVDDIYLAQSIKNKFLNANVYLLDKKYNCIEYEHFLEKFDFVISSRFHSIVHSYKKYVPCIVFGWAVKYKELLHILNQDNMMFDCRENIDVHAVKNMIDYLITNRKHTSLIIKENVERIQKDNCFDKMWEVLKNG